jgi:hypothetical protein
MQRSVVHGHAIVAIVSINHRSWPLTYLGDRVVHASPKFGL